jgi:hypothetical protein
MARAFFFQNKKSHVFQSIPKRIHFFYTKLYVVLIAILAWSQLIAQEQRYLSVPLINENREEHLDLLQAASDNGCNAVALTIHWGSLHGFHSTQYPAGSGWLQIDNQIAKARALGMKIGIRINVNTACPKQYDPGMYQNTCDGWLANERMLGAKADGSDPLYVHQINGGPSNADPNIYVDAVMTSLAAQSTIQRIKDFTSEVINRYKYLANTNELLYVNLVYNRTSEAGFDTETTKNDAPPVLYDYSQPMITGFRSWLQQVYCEINVLNSNWGTTYLNFDEIYPKRPSGTFQSAFQGNNGRDWFRYRTDVLKNISVTFANSVRAIDSRIKIITDYGSVFDILAVRRGNFDFVSIDGGMDGIKINDAPHYDHRFAMDLIRSNLPGKMVMNEVEFSGDANSSIQQLEQCFKHGAKLVTVFQLQNLLNQGHGSRLKQFANDHIRGSNGSVSIINPSQSASFDLSSMIDAGGCRADGSSPITDCDAYRKWYNAYNLSNMPVNIVMNNDLSKQNCNIQCINSISINSSNSTPTKGSNFTLNASCSGEGCSNINYSWTGNGISGSGPSINIIAPPNAGALTYTATATKAGCEAKFATINIRVIENSSNLEGCYTIQAKHSNKFIQPENDTNGSRIRQYEKTGQTNQIFQVKSLDNGFYTLLCKANSKVWDVNGSENGTSLIQSDWSDKESQQWSIQAMVEGSFKISPKAFSEKVVDVEGLSNAQGAGLHLWESNNTDNQRFIISTTECDYDQELGTGLSSKYFNNTNLSGNPIISRTDESINFLWGNSGPGNGINTDNFSVRWEGQIKAPYSGSFNFITNNDDGTRLWINDQLLIDDWFGHAPTWKQGNITLVSGQKYNIKMDYFEGDGGAQAQLFWEYFGQASQIVPKTRLYPVTNCNPPAQPTIQKTSGTVCNATGQGITLTASNYVGRIIWFRNETQLSVQTANFDITSEGTYFAKSDLNGCFSAASNVLAVTQTAGCGQLSSNGSGLTGKYFNNTTLTGDPVMVRIDETINFLWGLGRPDDRVNFDNFSVRWEGKIEAPSSGVYTFKTNNDDGTRLWVNGQLLIDDWRGHAPLQQQGSINLISGQKYSIIIEYFDAGDGAQAMLYWEYPGQATQIVPKNKLYPLDGCSSPQSPTLSANPQTINLGQTATLTASGCSGGTITWSNGLGTGTSKSVSPSSTATYDATEDRRVGPTIEVNRIFQSALTCTKGIIYFKVT